MLMKVVIYLFIYDHQNELIEPTQLGSTFKLWIPNNIKY